MEKIYDEYHTLLEWWAETSSLTYGEINVLLFIIIQPLLITTFFVLTQIAVQSKKENTKKIVKKLVLQ